MDDDEDRAELHDSTTRAAIEESQREYEAGKSRPIEEFFAELDQKLHKS